MNKFTNINDQYLIWDLSAIHFMTSQEMIDDVSLFNGNIIKTSGYSTMNDGGQGLFVIQNAKPSTPYLQLTNGLYAVFLYQPFYDLKAFGIDENEEISDKFVTIANWCATNNITLRLTNDYMVDLTKGLVLPSNFHLVGDNEHKLYGKTPYNLTHYGILKISNVHDITIET